MRQKPLLTVIDQRAAFAAGMAPAQWIREQRQKLEWLGFPRRHSAWLKSFAAMSPHLHPDQPLWGDTLPALLGEWTQQAELPSETQRKPGSKPSPASLAETQWLKDFSTTKGDKWHTQETRPRPPSSRIRQTPANPQQRRRPSASSSLTPHSTAITDQFLPPLVTTEKPSLSGKPKLHRLQSRIAESILKKITGNHLNALPASSTLLDKSRGKPFVPFSDVQMKHPPPAVDHPTLRQNQQSWQNGIAERVLMTMKTKALGDPNRKTLPGPPEALIGQWQLTLDGPQALHEQLVRSTDSKAKADKQSLHHTKPAAPDTAKKMPLGNQTMDKDSQGWIPETAEPSPTAPPAARTTGNTEVMRKHGRPDAPNVEQRHQQQPLFAAPGPDRDGTQAMPAEPILDGLIHEAASGIPGITSKSLAPGHGPLPANPPAPSGQTRPPTVLDKPLAAQPDLGDLANQIKQILDDEARRHGIDV